MFFKKTIIVPLVLTLANANYVNSQALASQSNDKSLDVILKCTDKAWEIGGMALYLQPNVSSGLSSSSKSATNGDNEESYFSKNPNWGWGFLVEGTYHHTTGKDLSLNWYHLNSNKKYTLNSTRNLNSLNDSGINIFNITANDISMISFNNTNSQINPQWDAVNLEFGQLAQLGEYSTVRLHAGLEYARLTTNDHLDILGSATTVTDTTTTFASTISNRPTYNGIGPRIGADMSRDWGNGFAMYLNGGSTLLVGSSKYSTKITNKLLAISTINRQSTNLIVPSLEAKLGGTYAYNLIQGNLTVDFGWMWINYFNATRYQSSNSILSVTAGNFGLNGAYLGLKWYEKL